MIGKLLGHSQVETTARYAHLARDSVQESAARIADSIATDILGEGWRHASGQCASHALTGSRAVGPDITPRAETARNNPAAAWRDS